MNKIFIVESATLVENLYQSKFYCFMNKDKAIEYRDKLVENKLYEVIFTNNMSGVQAAEYRKNVFKSKVIRKNGEIICDTDDEWLVGFAEGVLND